MDVISVPSMVHLLTNHGSGTMSTINQRYKCWLLMLQTKTIVSPFIRFRHFEESLDMATGINRPHHLYIVLVWSRSSKVNLFFLQNHLTCKWYIISVVQIVNAGDMCNLSGWRQLEAFKVANRAKAQMLQDESHHVERWRFEYIFDHSNPVC